MAPLSIGTLALSSLFYHLQALVPFGRTGNGICLTPGCVDSTRELRRGIDSSVDPCDDFFRYTCGGWIDSHKIPDDSGIVSVDTELDNELSKKLLLLLEQRPNAEEPPVYSKARNLYKSCMDEDAREALGSEPLLKLIRHLGGWPVVGAESGWTNATPYDWVDHQIRLTKAGLKLSSPINLDVVTDQKNNSRYIIEIDQPLSGVPNGVYLKRGLKDPILAAYYKVMVDSALKLGAANRTDAELQMMSVLRLSAVFYKIGRRGDELRNVSQLYNKMKLHELSKLTPTPEQIDWQRFLTGVFEVPIGQDEEIVVTSPRVLEELERVLISVNKTVVANYLIWRVVESSINSLDQSWRDLGAHFGEVYSGRRKQSPREKTCLLSTFNAFPIPLSALYVRKHFDAAAMQQVVEMVEYIRDEFRQTLTSVDWMDEETRREALKKLDAMSTQIGHPAELLDDRKIEQLHAGLDDMDPKQYYSNALKFSGWTLSAELNKLRRKTEEDRWTRRAGVAVINAHYNVQLNKAFLFAGILQGVYFNHLRPKYMNYGAIGWVVGHEITHGFDNLGKQYDSAGNSRNWWANETSSHFDTRAGCFVDQYGSYKVPEVNGTVNGNTTLGENIADNGGVKLAFRAYERWLATNNDGEEEPSLPGMKLTPRQLLWISMASTRCSKERPEFMRTRVLLNEHSPSRYRVNAVMSNSMEFSETFKCPVGSPMNPQRKCSVW